MNKLINTLLSIPVILMLFSCGGKEKAAPPPLEVPVTKVVQQDVRIESEYTGQTYGQSDIEINPRVDGIVESIHFKEGSLVTKGQLLYVIDPLPYKNKVDQAAGKVAEAKSLLAKSKSDLDMIEPLAKMNAVSQRELVAAKSQYEAAKAQLQSAQASMNNANIDLSYCSITAPISGVIGITKARVGDYVRPGPMAKLNTISELTDMRVRFTISEQEYLRIFREISSDSSSLKGAGKTIRLILSDGTLYPYTGELSFFDREVDPTTGAITLEAAFTNPDKLLRPGQYVKVSVVTRAYNNALLIPQRSVIEMQGIFQVYVLGDSNKVALKIIQPGPTYKDAYVVLDGLKASDKIAMGGTSLLKNGSIITPKVNEWMPSSPEMKTVPSK